MDKIALAPCSTCKVMWPRQALTKDLECDFCYTHRKMNAIKCRKPLVHNPQFEAKFHCKRCAAELKENI